MNIGKGCYIADRWIPEGIDTGLKDINGIDIYTRNKVKLNGCSSGEAIVGIGIKGKVVLFFGTENGSCSWDLDEEVIKRNKVMLDTEDMIEWTFSEETLWENSCNKCCQDECDNVCEQHCANIFRDFFCCGCRYDELTIGKKN